MAKIRLIALDLDGTLLDSRKRLSEANAEALRLAAAGGALIVPTTGRFYEGMPECVKELPFIYYAITMNGAEVYDVIRSQVISSADMDLETALSLMEYFDQFDVIYDCFQDDWGHMTASMWDRVEKYTDSPFYVDMLRRLREPVPDLKAYLRERGRGIQKTQLFTKDPALRERIRREVREKFPSVNVSSSVPENIEFNSHDAHKGAALMKLAQHLGIAMEETAAFGDGSNDVSMLSMAGIGIAMANACPEALEAADLCVSSCDADGVAEGIRLLCFH